MFMLVNIVLNIDRFLCHFVLKKTQIAVIGNCNVLYCIVASVIHCELTHLVPYALFAPPAN